MRALLQRVTRASVTVRGEPRGAIGPGLVILLGITHKDTPKDAQYLVKKSTDLRIFNDSEGKMNLSLKDVGGQALIVSQFTLYADTRRGRRPGYSNAARPETAIPLYEAYIRGFREQGIHTETGEFGADMSVEIQNDGPVTLMLDSSMAPE